MPDSNQSPFWHVAGCVLAGTAVALGAWAAHGLETTLANVYGTETREVFGRSISAVAKYVGDFRTGATYQMWHALAILAVAGWAGKLAATGRFCLFSGTLIFSGSLYVLALSGVRWWGAVTPIGGLLLLVGWTSLAVAAAKARGSHSKQSLSGTK